MLRNPPEGHPGGYTPLFDNVQHRRPGIPCKPGRYPVTAPLLAEETRRAYFASAPVE